MIEQPAVFSIKAAQTIFHAEFMTGIERGDVGIEATLEVFRMYVSYPTIAYFLLHCPPGKFQPALIKIVEKFVRSGDPDQHRRTIRHSAETGFTLQQRRRRPFALSHIGDEAVPKHRAVRFPLRQ